MAVSDQGRLEFLETQLTAVVVPAKLASATYTAKNCPTHL